MKRYFRELIVTLVFSLTVVGITGATIIKKTIKLFTPKEEVSDVNKGHELEKEKNKEKTNKVNDLVNGFTEDLAGKEEGAKAASKISKAASMGISIDNPQVLLGKEDWLFYKTTEDGDPMSDYQGTNHYSDEKMASIASKLEQYKQIFNSHGKEFYVMSIPNKSNVYPEYMPDSVERADTTTRTDLFMDYLSNNTDIGVINCKQDLIDAKSKYQVYYSSDTHFNDIGAFVASQTVLSVVTGQKDSLDTVKFNVTNENYSGDLAALCEMSDIFNEDTSYQLDTSTIDASKKSDKRVLIIGDSFSDVIQPVLANYFADVTAVGVWSYHMYDLDSYAPDIVIWENAERYTDRFDWINITKG